VKYGFNDAFLAVHYKFITGKFTFNPGLSVHRYTTFNEQLSTKQDDNSRVLPDLFAQYQIKKSESLTYNFRKQMCSMILIHSLKVMYFQISTL
jgi:hypothetical protein